jgi:hypothetical protein
MSPFILIAALTICWQAPTENVDGSAIEGVLAYSIHYGPSPGNYDSIIDIGAQTAADQGNCEIRDVAPGDYYIAMKAIDTLGDESAYSNEIMKTQASTTPLPPVILALPQTVFNVVKQDDRFVLLPIGTVPPGTVCDPNQSVNGHGVVPAEDVAWLVGSTVRPVVVVARCDG